MIRRLPLLLLAVALLAPAVPVAAQSDTLDRVESLLASGRLTEARATLDRWNQANPPGRRGASSEERARAKLLEGRLTPDVSEAESAYMSVVLSYPRTPAASEALLRLGQVLVAVAMADNDTVTARRAVDYLDRLVSEYPGSEHRTLGMLWLARAHQLAGDLPSACTVTRDALRAGVADPVMNGLLETEQSTLCSAVADSDVRPSTPPAQRTTPPPARQQTERPPARQQAERPPDERRDAGAEFQRFAVQAAALRDRNGADNLAERLRRAGFEPRVVRVEGSSLYRVRLGRYTGTQPAAQLARRVRQAGFDAVVVTDAHREVR